MLERCVQIVEEVRSLPYHWPGPPDAMAALREGRGTCASKHALLADRLEEIGIETAPLLMVGRLVPASLADRFPEAAGLLEVHECLTVSTPWAGPLAVDVTWDPALVVQGFPGVLPWNGLDDMPFAIKPEGRAWAVPRHGLRAAKEAIRARLYTDAERALRDRTLAELATIFAAWRAGGQ